MIVYSKLKAIWKKLGINGHVKNYSNVDLWVIETDSDSPEGPFARRLLPGHKTPPEIDVDGLKRVDGKAIQGHKNWWKFYDFSTVDVYTDGSGLKLSVISKVAVSETEFGSVKYLDKNWGVPLTVILDIKRNSRNKIISYYVSGHGWLDFESTFKMTCYHEIDNARPVFPKKGVPYIRSKRDKMSLNNFNKKVRS